MKSHTQVSVAVEDRFLIIGIRQATFSLPHIDTAECLAATVACMDGDYTIVIDIRGLEDLYTDVKEFIWGLVEMPYQEHMVVIVRNKLEEEILQYLTQQTESSSFKRILGVKKTAPRLDYTSFDMAKFAPDYGLDELPHCELSTWEQSGRPGLPSRYRLTKYETAQDASGLGQEDYESHVRASEWEYRIALLCDLINRRGKNSLLNEFAFTINNDYITVTPYHSHSFYQTTAPDRSQTIIAKPGVIAKQTGSILSQELKEFEAIINESKVRESKIDKFLRQHKHFFRGLNYQNIYPQLVLERPGKRDLVPDFICEPVGSEWCDILDLKIPITKPIDVGGADRARFGYQIADGCAQLREYAAWFDDEQNFKSFRKKYGLNIYRPKLKLMVGHDPRMHDEKQLRRMMTSYADIDILTYDEFLRICKRRLLI